MEIATWIMAVSSIVSMPISIWAIVNSHKAIKISNNIENKFNSGNRNNIIMDSKIENNGRDGVHIGR